MAILKCKMCGGDLNYSEGASTAECEYCGSLQTIPKVDSEKKITLFARANRLRAACDFDKAAGIYETIVADFPEEAEAYWGLVLCNYGIEYVDDPATGKKIPTCHRSGFESVMKDTNVELAQEYADVMARRLYREEAKQIEELRKGIIAVSANEAPYDVFICYKETDFNGKRTLDSVLAQDIFDALTDKGYRVFFSRISLEDKLGTEYEPYIFAALNSAKIMLVIGTDFEYFNAVWVKNEWSRFLKLMAQDKQKHLIPCYKGIDAYDMPEEFARLQAQDLDKMGAIQDIVRGVQKLLPKQPETVKETVVVQQTVSAGGVAVSNLIRRAEMALEDEKWKVADEFCEQILNADVENGYAYLYKFMAAAHISSRLVLIEKPELFWEAEQSLQRDAARARQYAKGELSQWLEQVNDSWEKVLERRRQIEEERRRQEEEERRRQEEEARRRQEEEERRRQEERARLEAIAEEQRQVTEGKKLMQEIQSRVTASKSIWTYRAAYVPYTGRVQLADKPGKISKIVNTWSDIVAVSQCDSGIVALAKDGSAFNTFDAKQRSFGNIAVAAGGLFAFGLSEKQSVQMIHQTFNGTGVGSASVWEGIQKISCGMNHMVGLRTHGTVFSSGERKNGQCDTAGWTNMIDVSAGYDITIGIKKDGTALIAGKTPYSSITADLRSWNNIVQVSAGYEHAVGLKTDGTVVIAGNKNNADSSWKDIVAVCAGYACTIGVRADGTILVAGKIKHGRENIEGKNIFEDLSPQQRQEMTQKLVKGREFFFKNM